jgi:DNA (cytosine-5)-methyltransferase 1
MTNHPNRRPRGGIAPSPDLLRELRDGALLTQAQAGALVHATLKTWQAWEYGQRRMPLAAMELFVLALIAPRHPCALVRPGEWVREWVRPELLALFTSQARPAPTPAAAIASPALP